MQFDVFLGVFKGILYNAVVFPEHFFDYLNNFSFEVYTKLGKHNIFHVVV